ncbi:MAG: NHLP leader peptide family RiPP precursor [Peptococcaceae bacterium MAG4]|nr:NHLP leader peptide family RiPP precursor [Peptococcaceae bacterium MAG4]
MKDLNLFHISREVEKRIIEKAREDADFKRTLLEKPHEAIARFGVQVPEEVEIKVVEESAKVLYLVLPENPDELTDKQLDEVSAAGYCLNNGIIEIECSSGYSVANIPSSDRLKRL